MINANFLLARTLIQCVRFGLYQIKGNRSVLRIFIDGVLVAWLSIVSAIVLLVPAFSPGTVKPEPDLIRLPAPSGQFQVGRASYDWTDQSRPEPLALPAGPRREVLVYVWYPAEKAKTTRPAPYFPGFQAAKTATPAKDFTEMFGPAADVIEKHGLPQTHSEERASISAGKRKYPVLVFSHGWGMQSTLYTAALEDLASHGFVVVGIDHPYDTTVTVFPDGRVVNFAQDRYDAASKAPNGLVRYTAERVEVMSTDIRFVINELSRYDRDPRLGAPFRGHLDLERVGAFGHSIGGLTSVRACQIDTRIRACVDEDSVLEGSPFSVASPIPKQPFLLFVANVADIFSYRKLHPSEEILERLKVTRAEYEDTLHKQREKQRGELERIDAGAYRVMVFDLRGFTHQSFSDLPLLGAARDQAKWEETRHNFEVTQAYLLAFFDKYLNGNQSTILDADSAPDKLVRIDRFGRARLSQAH